MLTENQISIRLASEGDLESLVTFNLAMAEETESKQLNEKVLRAGVLHLLKNPRYGFYVVAEDATPKGPSVIGSLMVTYEWSDWRNALFWWIQSVYVKPPYRRKGIYRRLYAFVKECANKEKGVCGFRLYVERENSIAQQTYKNLGMEESHYLMFEEGCTSQNWE